MLDKPSVLTISNYNWEASKPILRYVLGISFVLLITSMMNYPLAHLTTVLSIGYIAPGTKPLSLKQGAQFLIALIIINFFGYIFTSYLINYPLVFMPLMCLGLLWIYYTDKLALMIKLFAIISIVVIPMIALESNVISGYVALSLVFNAFMALTLTQLVFLVFPWSDADEVFAKAQQNAAKKSEKDRFRYARNILFILMPVLFLFFIFNLTGGLLILIFITILSISPVLANVKFGAIFIIANILGGLFAILAYNLLVIVPLLVFMILLTLIVGFLFGRKLFSKHKYAPIFATGFTTFLLILGSVTSAEMDAGEKVWSRLSQITIAIIYVVIAFKVIHYFEQKKIKKQNG